MIDEVDQALDTGNVSNADLIYLAMPVSGIINFLKERGNQIREDAIVTDTGSTKSEICEVAYTHLSDKGQFIGGHPIAGSHFAGLAHARTDLFQNAPYVLIQNDKSDTNKLSLLKETVELIGARVEVMTATGHDRAFSLVSHLPQLLSSALASTIMDQPDAVALLRLSGSGYKDMTRLAASSWSIWKDIFTTNRFQLAEALDALIVKLNTALDELNEMDNTNPDLKAISKWFEKRS
jgi:prephenate dehydrogenase